ncbi:AMP-binding protein [Candidatus Pseudothioglobus singularis]|nr:AMP-binding protein [Candidatus Pseudothioglobus singularis]MDA7440817.1 AMP-binding protein [Candidatus Pseudothioglobus singularis]MDB4822952.1 AMP-binding protein [Candidatus Pseudothioglobus singularis]
METKIPNKLEETEFFKEHGNLVEFFDNCCREHKGKTAFESFGVELTYEDLSEKVDAFASWLSGNFQVGDRVAVMMPNMLVYPLIVYGALKAGIVVVNINPLYTQRELEHVLRDSEAKLLLVWEGVANVAAKSDLANVEKVLVTTVGDLLGFKGKIINLVTRKVKKLVPKYHIDGATMFLDVLNSNEGSSPESLDISIESTAFLQYTGGTTGVSKGAVLTHRNILANIIQAFFTIDPKMYDDSRNEQRIAICPLPLYHIFALTVHNFMLFHIGGRSVLITNPRDLKTFVSIMKKHKFHMISGVNTLYEALLNYDAFKELDFSNLLMSLSGGMAALDTTAKRWAEVTKSVIWQAYGLTETSPLVSVNDYKQTEFTGSVGLPAAYTEIEIRDESGNALSETNAVGELCVRGPQVMSGYWKSKVSGLDENNWFMTGDIARIDETGNIFIVDRKKDMIIVSGFNVFPNEVEAVVNEHPAVLECGCVGVEGENSQELVKVFIVLHDGQTATEDEIISFCREKLTAYKVPKHIEFIKEIPKTNVGKVLRRELKEN